MRFIKGRSAGPSFLLSIVTAGAAVGITYAIVSQQTTLAANSISSATADLKIKSTNKNWSNSAPGFKIKDLVPGSGVTEPIYFENAGKVSLNLSARIPTRPALGGFTGWNNVLIDIIGNSCGSTVHTTIASLFSAPVTVPCGPLSAGTAGDSSVSNHTGNYSLRFDINQSAITGTKATVGSFDIQFTGAQ